MVINGHIEFSDSVAPTDEFMKKLGRNFDLLFDRDPTRIRNSMFFGWLKSARIVNLRVRPPAKKKEAEPDKSEAAPGPVATEEQEQAAAQYLIKAKKYLAEGLEDKAKKFLNKILALPKNASQGEAKQLLDKLK